MSQYIFRIKLPKEEVEEEEEKKEDEENNEENKEGEGEGEAEGEGGSKDNQKKENISPDLEEEEEDDDSQLTDPLEIKKKFLFRCICLQLYNSDLQISKKLHQFFDPEKKGFCSMKQCIFTLLNYYKIVMLPKDLKVVLMDYVMEQDDLDSPDDLLEVSFSEDSLTKVDYQIFLQEVTRPYVYQVAKKELFMSYQNLMILMYESTLQLLDLCKASLMDLFLNEQELEINSYDAFSQFL